MFQDAFIKLDEKESNAVLTEINPHLQGSEFNAANATILGQEAVFYPGYRFLEIANYEVTPYFQKFVLYKPGHVTVMDGTNTPIYALNKEAPILLQTETVTDYVRFFFKYVRGPQGKFTIIESVDDIAWKDEPPPAARKAVGKMIRPVTLNGENADGSYHLTACMTFKETLYKVSVFVKKSGEIVTADEEILVDDLPVTDDTLGQ